MMTDLADSRERVELVIGDRPALQAGNAEKPQKAKAYQQKCEAQRALVDTRHRAITWSIAPTVAINHTGFAATRVCSAGLLRRRAKPMQAETNSKLLAGLLSRA